MTKAAMPGRRSGLESQATPEVVGPPGVGPVRVLFIVGSGRSGSTLLDMLLGQVEGVFSTGELHSLWAESILDGRRCGCGDPVVECSVWRAVLERIIPGGSYREEALRLARLHRRLVRPSIRPDRERSSFAHAYATHAARLYRTIAEVTGARLLVDSSKQPAVAALLPGLADVQPYFVHLIRDPRAVAYSWRRRKGATDRYGIREMDRYIAPRTALRWLRDQRAAEILRRGTDAPWRTVRYEDLVADPARTIRGLLDLTGQEPASAALLEGSTVRLRCTHTVSGNPVRLRRGSLTIAADDEWRTAMRPSRRWLVSVLTAAALRRYGYPLAPGVQAVARPPARVPAGVA